VTVAPLDTALAADVLDMFFDFGEVVLVVGSSLPATRGQVVRVGDIADDVYGGRAVSRDVLAFPAGALPDAKADAVVLVGAVRYRLVHPYEGALNGLPASVDDRLVERWALKRAVQP